MYLQVITVPEDSSVQSTAAPNLQKVPNRPEIIEEIMAQEQAVTGIYSLIIEWIGCSCGVRSEIFFECVKMYCLLWCVVLCRSN